MAYLGDDNDENVPSWKLLGLEGAEAFVKRCLDAATPEQKEKIYREYAGIRAKLVRQKKKKPKKPVAKGGARTGTTGTDAAFYDFMQLVDTCHDFADDEADLATIREVMASVRLPNKFDEKLLLNEKLLIEYLTSQKQFKFGEAIIQNPLYKADILQKTAIEPNDTLQDLCNRQQNIFKGKYGSDTSLIPVEIITTHPNPPTNQLLQIAAVCRTIRDKFGNDCFFCLDCANDQIALAMTNIQDMSTKIYENMFHDISMQEISQGLKKAIERTVADGILVPIVWKAEVTDANMFDTAATSRALESDESPTGNVFRGDRGPQIFLNGIERKNGNQKYVGVTFTDVDGVSVSSDFTSKESPRYFSLNVIRTYIGRPITTTKPSKHDQLMRFSDQMKYAMKRAGDWGQVEHCVKYNKVFVTADKFAALYAYYRGIRFILMREAHHNKSAAYPNLLSFNRYVFIIGHRRHKMHDSDENK